MTDKQTKLKTLAELGGIEAEEEEINFVKKDEIAGQALVVTGYRFGNWGKFKEEQVLVKFNDPKDENIKQGVSFSSMQIVETFKKLYDKGITPPFSASFNLRNSKTGGNPYWVVE